MKKLMLTLAVAALFGFSAQAAQKEIVKAVTLSTAVTNVVTYTAPNDRLTEPVLFVHTTTTTNTPVITVNPVLDGAPTYTVYTGTAKTNTTTTVVMNDYSDSTSAKVVLMPGDVLTITGTAANWAAAGYYVVVKETVQ